MGMRWPQQPEGDGIGQQQVMNVGGQGVGGYDLNPLPLVPPSPPWKSWQTIAANMLLFVLLNKASEEMCHQLQSADFRSSVAQLCRVNRDRINQMFDYILRMLNNPAINRSQFDRNCDLCHRLEHRNQNLVRSFTVSVLHQLGHGDVHYDRLMLEVGQNLPDNNNLLGRARRFTLWCQRNPKTAIAAALAGVTGVIATYYSSEINKNTM